VVGLADRLNVHARPGGRPPSWESPGHPSPLLQQFAPHVVALGKKVGVRSSISSQAAGLTPKFRMERMSHMIAAPPCTSLNSCSSPGNCSERQLNMKSRIPNYGFQLGALAEDVEVSMWRSRR